MKQETLGREQARAKYGDDFVERMMRGKNRDQITVNAKQLVLLEQWRLMREKKLMPFAYEYVYFLANERGEFKIGYTREPKTRMSSFMTGTTENLRLAGLILIGGQVGRNVERALHTEWKSRGAHVSREWFKGDVDVEKVRAAEYARMRYGKHLVPLAAARDGCEPIWQIYVAANKHCREADDCVKARNQFMWVVDQVESGLTILS